QPAACGGRGVLVPDLPSQHLRDRPPSLLSSGFVWPCPVDVLADWPAMEKTPMQARMLHQHPPRTRGEAYTSQTPPLPLESLAWGLMYGGLLSLLGWGLALRLLLGLALHG